MRRWRGTVSDWAAAQRERGNESRAGVSEKSVDSYGITEGRVAAAHQTMGVRARACRVKTCIKNTRPLEPIQPIGQPIDLRINFHPIPQADQLVGAVLLAVAVAVFSYYTVWVMVLVRA